MIIKRALGVTTDFPEVTSQETNTITESISGTLTELKTIIIDAKQNTDATIAIEPHTTGNVVIVTNAAHVQTNTTINIGEHANITLTLVFKEQKHHMNTTTINVGTAATINTNGVVWGQGQLITTITTNLLGEGATGNAHIFIEGEGTYDVNYTTDHQAPQTNSDTVVKGLISTKVINRNLVRIRNNANGSQGYEQSHFLVLNKDARAVSIPDLEIHNHNVQCSHGATVTSIDEEQIYYLQARGLDREEAKRMIINGFRDESLRRIPGEIVGKEGDDE